MKQITDLITSATRRIHSDLDLYDVLSGALEAQYAEDRESLRELDQRARRSTYVTVIIACYGVIEQTIDEILISTTIVLNSVYPSRSALPEKVQKDHRELLLRCLIDGDRARTRMPVEEAAALAALGTSSEAEPGLIGAAFTLSTANYRWDYVAQLLSRLSVNLLQRISNITTEEADRTGFNSFESFLIDLVQRRNDVAHSYGDDDTLSPDLLRSYVDTVGAYLRSVNAAVTEELLSRVIDVRLTSLGTVVKRWEGRVGVKMERGRLSVGDRLLLVKHDAATVHTVRSLQSQDQGADHFEVGNEALNVAAGVDLAPTNCEGAASYVVDDDWADLLPTAMDGS
ncbi:HEPN domain-containing protein [Curtobacterium sp. PhB78]|uniref:HEPN domain-containing protein n=1 Tax=Curtobacterium sp. PhB78 TaxID=2485102 RepID=UPI000F972B92|nr:HEPN domain-containing protein [Curtobacterium sp. PhB78]ROS46186.1 hypothetical protein EDF53_1005 [Curtobacterium sp. PhB78]